MTKYILKRLLHGVVSIIIVVGCIMVMVYSLLDRNLVFANDGVYTRQSSNQKVVYMYSGWEDYGYLEYVSYADYLVSLESSGEIDEETKTAAAAIGATVEEDPELVSQYVEQFTAYYESKGYTVTRLDADMVNGRYRDGGTQQLFAYKEIPVLLRLVKYFAGLFTIDNINAVTDDVGERGLTFTLYDPIYGGDTFSPAILGNGTTHKYLMWVDSSFPFIHQNILTINLGTSYSVNQGVDVFTTMTQSQGSYIVNTITYPTGLTESSADDLHSATYASGSLESSTLNLERFTDNYTSVSTVKGGMSKLGYSFVIGIISVIGAYVLGLPLGLLMARRKDKLLDKLGTIYIVFIMAVPSLAYIFLFKALGNLAGLPTTFDMESTNKLIYLLPIVSLMLPAMGDLMKWMRRYMIDQRSSDYVKFARSGGLTEGEIFRKHIMKNAVIPIVQGIPASVLYALTGAIITERVYVVPGAGNLLTTAINKYDNAVIVGVALFYAVLSVLSIILGDVLMAMFDPRISFASKDR